MSGHISSIARSPFFIIYLLAAINLVVAYFFVDQAFAPRGDAYSYLDGMRYLTGQPLSDGIPYNRLLTAPLLLISSVGMSVFAGGNLFGGMLIVNLIFYFAIIYVFYRIVMAIYHDRRVALLSSILFFSNYAMFNFGTNFIADIGGWFFFLLATLFALYYYRGQGRRWFFWAVAASSIGFLFKEYAVLGLVSLVMLIAVSPSGWSKKIKDIMSAGALFALIPALYHLYFFITYHYSYFNWYALNIDVYAVTPESTAAQYSLALLIKVLGWLYLAGWPIFIFGLLMEKKYFNGERTKILIALLPASLAFLAWPALTQRIAFICVPWLALISGFGLSKIKSKTLVLGYLALYLAVAYSMRELPKLINLPF